MTDIKTLQTLYKILIINFELHKMIEVPVMTFTEHDLLKQIEPLRRFARKLSKSDQDAEDLLQTTILQAMEKQHLFQEGTNLFSWMSKIMYNKFVSQYRRSTKFESQYDNEGLIERQSCTADQDRRSELNVVEEAMNELSEEHRDILILICVKGMQYNEAAGKLDIPVGTVRSRLSRAREQLKDLLEIPQDAPMDMSYLNTGDVQAARVSA